MAKKLKKLLNYWFNPENYSIIKSINGIIDTVNELVDGGGGGYTLPIATTETLGGVKVDGTSITANEEGVISAIGGGGSVKTLNWTKVDTTVAIPPLIDLGVFKQYTISSNNFNIEGNHKGLMIESDYFASSGGDLAQNNSLTFSVILSNGVSYTLGVVKSTETAGSYLNRVRFYVVKNPITGLYQMGYSTTLEERRTMGDVTTIVEVDATGLDTNTGIKVLPLNVATDITSISLGAAINTDTGAFATQGGVTFSLYVAD